MIRRNWLAGLGLALLAAACAFSVYIVAAWGLSIAAPNLWFDANNRARIVDDIQHTASSLSKRHKSRAQIAQALVARVNEISGYSVAVIDDTGKLLAGDRQLIPERPAGMPALRAPEPGRPHAEEFRGLVFGMHPPVSHNIAFLRWPFSTIASPASIVHINGAAVVFAPPGDSLTSIQQLERRIVIAIVIATFILVWFFGGRMLVGATRPFERLRGALLRLSRGDYARFETFSPQDDVAVELVQAYNAAASQVEMVSRQRTEIETKIRQFVADAGHELRTPLAVIMGYVQLLRQSGQSNDAMSARVFAEIDDQGKRMSTLIQKLLLLTRLESQEPNDVKILDAADVTTSVVDSFRPLANGSLLKIDATHDAFVQVSESELHEAIGNLIDNALKYAPGANIEARVRAEGDTVYIAVSDDGPGMSPDVRARAFERFSRGELGGSISGSGLGLAIVERAVERAGGSVSLQTALGKGTTVELRLPAWQHLDPH
ncbi:MAG: HAMP domain-containing histidine kinase [Candidatus Eremiobacteraeota bacterium]|nr:HAMP domain-containing histidine kinase [Candidatus Eremiobacteraeota bacterium]